MGRFGFLSLLLLITSIAALAEGKAAATVVNHELGSVSLEDLGKRADLTVATSRHIVPSVRDREKITLAEYCRKRKLTIETIKRNGHTLLFLSPVSNLRLRNEWLKLADSGNEDDRCIAARWLYRDGSREAVVKTLALLQDKSLRVRTYAAHACGNPGPRATEKVHPFVLLAPEGTVEAVGKDLARLAAAHRKGGAGGKRFAYLQLAARLRDPSFVASVEAIARHEIADSGRKLGEQSTITSAVRTLRLFQTPQANAALVKLYKDIKTPKSHRFLFEALLAIDSPETRALIEDAVAGRPEGVDRWEALSDVCGRVRPWSNRFRGRPRPWTKPILLKTLDDLKKEVQAVKEEVADLKREIGPKTPPRDRVPLGRAEAQLRLVTRQLQMLEVAVQRMESKDLKERSRREIEAQTDPGRKAQQLWNYAYNHFEPDKWSHELCRKLASKKGGGRGQETALNLLAGYADPADVRLLADLMKSDLPRNQRSLVIRCLAAIGTPEALDLLKPFLKSKEARDRALTAQYIGKYGHRGLSPALREALNDPDTWIRASAARALGAIGTKDDIPALLKAADGPRTRRNRKTGKEQPDYYRAAETALEAIGAIGGPEAIAILTKRKALQALLKSPHVDCRKAVRALAEDKSLVADILATPRMFYPVQCNETYYLVPALIQLAQATDPKTRQKAIEQLLNLAAVDPRAIDVLSQRAMRDSNFLVRRAAVKALVGDWKSIPDAKALPALIAILKQGDKDLKYSASRGIRAIGADGGPEAIEAIEMEKGSRQPQTL